MACEGGGGAAAWDERRALEWCAEALAAPRDAAAAAAALDALRGLRGAELLALDERDLREDAALRALPLRDRKRLLVRLRALQRDNRRAMIALGLVAEGGGGDDPRGVAADAIGSYSDEARAFANGFAAAAATHRGSGGGDASRPPSEDGGGGGGGGHRSSRLRPEIFKAFLSLCYAFAVTWVTAVVMVIVHDKVPDMKKYPPLPDLFLDNVPHIPWAFDMCEITGSILMAIWMGVLLFHKHRFILLRRFFALSGTVFLLRCITMLITSLSVPGGHLTCAPRHYASDEIFSNWSRRFNQAYAIWTGAGMSVRGVRTCGDYMFSGHTVALTILNFFITEYTSRSLYLLHIATWLMNMFGIFFILAAHEHYSIDVFIAFYITSRLFLYYHTLSNNQALMQGDSLRTRIWFPLLSFFESEVDGIVPNEYESPLRLLVHLKGWLCQLLGELSETSLVQFVGNSLSQQAAIVDFSAARVLDNVKRNLGANNDANNGRVDAGTAAAGSGNSSPSHSRRDRDGAIHERTSKKVD